MGIHPDLLTVGGLLAEVIAGMLFATNQMNWGLGILLVGQLLDTFDGELARLSQSASPYGGFLDSICDHYGDLAVYLGFLWHFLDSNGRVEIMLVVVALFGSVFGSHVRSRAGMAGVDAKGIGLFTRFERTLVIALGILLHELGIALWVLAALTNFSALQRIIYALWARRNSDSNSS